MTVESNLARKPYTISGAGPYAIPFYFLADADIIAIQTPASGAAPITLALTTDYTLSGAGDTAGGALTLIKTGIDGDTLTIINEPDIVQLTQYPETGPFPSKSHETALDKLTIIAKRIYDIASRSLRLNDGDPASSLELPAPSDGKLLGWLGGVLVNTSPAGVGPGSIGTAEISATYDGTLLHNTGNEAVAGIKTFSSSPAVPTATTSGQAVNKGQMDTADAAVLVAAESYTDSATALFAVNPVAVTILTSGTSHVLNTKTTRVQVEMVGGGGGGASQDAGIGSAGPGGGSGAYLKTGILSTGAASTLAYSVGAGGNGGKSNAVSGGGGGASSVTINGTTFSAAGGAGGVAAGGPGSGGGLSAASADRICIAGGSGDGITGAASIFSTAAGATGNNVYGGGGGGSPVGSNNGGNGGAGLVKITEYA